MFAATAEGSRLAILVPGQQSLILLSITTQGTSNGSTLLCQPMRHLNATSMAPAYSTVEGCCDLLVLNSRGELHIISQDDRQLPVHPGQLEGKPTMLRASSLSTVEVVCTLADGSRQSIDVQTLLKTKFPLVDHVISVLASYLGESFSPVLVKFWQLHWKLRSRSLEGVLRALELAIVGGEADLADFAPSMHIHEGLSDWEWMQQDEASSADRSSSTVMAAGLPDDHLALCLYALHLVSEERKLFLATQRDVAALAYLIKKVAQKISAWDYVDVANRDGAPDKVKDVLHCTGCPSHHLPLPFDVHANLLRRLQLEATPRDPFVPMNVLSGELSQYSSGSSRSAREHFRPMRSLLSLYDLFRASSLTSSPLNGLEDAVLACANRGLTQDDLSALTAAVSLPLREAIRQCHGNAPSTWPKRAFALVDRADQMATAKGPAIGRRREVSIFLLLVQQQFD